MLESLGPLGVDRRVFYTVRHTFHCYCRPRLWHDLVHRWRQRTGSDGRCRSVVVAVPGVVQGRRARGGASGGFPSLQRLPLNRTRVRTVGQCGGDEPRDLCRSPHLLYIWHCATGAHQPSIRLGVPDQDASQGPSSPLGQLVEINTNILPLDLTLHF